MITSLLIKERRGFCLSTLAIKKKRTLKYGEAKGAVPPLEPAYCGVQPRDILRSIERHPDVLKESGVCPTIGQTSGHRGGRPTAEKPSIRSAFKRRRCLISADGFYEWQARGKGLKKPYRITQFDGLPLVFAGLWEARQEPDGDELLSCTIITTEANRLLREIHPRMPVIHDSADCGQWLDVDSTAHVRSLLRPAPDDRLMAYPMSTRINDVRNDDAACIIALSPAN